METHSKHLSADERKAVTIEAVVELAGTQNPSDITTGAIARHMNVTQGALFRHFPSKDAIWESVMGWVAERLLGQLEQAAAASPSPLAALEAMFLAHVDFVVQHPGVPRMLFGELQHARTTPAKRMAQTLMKRYADKLAARIAEGREAGEISASVDAGAAAVLFIGAIQGLVMQSLLSGDIARMRDAAPGVFAVYAAALRAAP